MRNGYLLIFSLLGHIDRVTKGFVRHLAFGISDSYRHLNRSHVMNNVEAPTNSREPVDEMTAADNAIAVI
jgi:hypothetical protein